MSAVVTYRGVLDMQVCVPWEWADEQIEAFAEKEYPCGTSGGWGIRRQGDKMLSGCDERVQCEDLPENCHVMLDA